MSGIMLGNLTIKQMEDRAGIKFPAELVEYMKTRHQSKAENVQPGKWHCFDLPFTLVCGDMETAKEIYSHLKPFSDKFTEPMQIALNQKGKS